MENTEKFSIPNSQFSILTSYFPDLTDRQKEQYAALYDLYTDWNAKINVISRKDIENLYPHHVLHSLGITDMLRFKPGSSVMDLGTGGGFPGIPLAILFPETHFHLVDSIGKKIKVGRAVMPLADLVKIVRKNIKKEQINALPNGLICLKGGELAHEILPFRNQAISMDLKDHFKEEFFETKKVVYVPL